MLLSEFEKQIFMLLGMYVLSSLKGFVATFGLLRRDLHVFAFADFSFCILVKN